MLLHLWLITLLLTGVFFLSLWIVDMSASAMILNRNLDNIYMKNIDANTSYHAGLIISMFSFMITLSLLAVFSFYHLKDAKNNQNGNTQPD